MKTTVFCQGHWEMARVPMAIRGPLALPFRLGPPILCTLTGRFSRVADLFCNALLLLPGAVGGIVFSVPSGIVHCEFPARVERRDLKRRSARPGSLLSRGSALSGDPLPRHSSSASRSRAVSARCFRASSTVISTRACSSRAHTLSSAAVERTTGAISTRAGLGALASMGDVLGWRLPYASCRAPAPQGVPSEPRTPRAWLDRRGAPTRDSQRVDTGAVESGASVENFERMRG